MGRKVVIDAEGVYYRQLNEQIREEVRNGATEIVLNNIKGQRYIGNGLTGDLKFILNGVAGPDTAAFMQGPYLRIEGNAQDGVGNTMDDGTVVINGMAGDVLGYAMRGGRVYVRQDVGYRVGIHMKSYLDKQPVIVVGGKAGDFLGEYMAGGMIILLGMDSVKPEAPLTGRSVATGMHGGVIYVRGDIPAHQLGPGMKCEPCDQEDLDAIRREVTGFAEEFGWDVNEILSDNFSKIKPFSHRPYGNMYVGTN